MRTTASGAFSLGDVRMISYAQPGDDAFRNRAEEEPGNGMMPAGHGSNHASPAKSVRSVAFPGSERLEHVGQIGLDTVLADAGFMQRAGTVFEFEQREQQVFGADVVVT